MNDQEIEDEIVQWFEQIFPTQEPPGAALVIAARRTAQDLLRESPQNLQLTPLQMAVLAIASCETDRASSDLDAGDLVYASLFSRMAFPKDAKTPA